MPFKWRPVRFPINLAAGITVRLQRHALVSPCVLTLSVANHEPHYFHRREVREVTRLPGTKHCRCSSVTPCIADSTSPLSA